MHLGEYENDRAHRLPQSFPARQEIEIFLMSSSEFRQQAVGRALQTINPEVPFRFFQGPAQEVGTSPIERARHKVEFGAQKLLDSGYLSRHPRAAIIFLGVDTRNIMEPGREQRDKASSENDYWRHQVDWERLSRGEGSVFSWTGYASFVMNGGKHLFELSDKVQVLPPDIRIVQQTFHPSHFPDKCRSAHTMNSPKLLEDRQEALRDLATGKILTGEPAIYRVTGASLVHFKAILHLAFQVIYES